MKLTHPILGLGLLVAMLAQGTPASVQSLELQAIQFPERRSIQVGFLPEEGAPEAKLKAEGVYRDGQTRIQMEFESMKPAVLYGGDVTCYVLWAVTLSGKAENLGELLVREPKGRLAFSTANKEFALLVTAEPYYLVSRPSELVAFRNAPFEDKGQTSISFDFRGLGPAPAHAMQSIRQISWDSDVPLDLLQARKAFEVATRRDAAIHAARVYSEAGEALAAANELARKGRGNRELLDNARRAVALSNEAINLTVHRLEARALEEQVAQRRSEMERIERRAREAEAQADVARSEAEAVRRQQQRLSVEIDGLVRSRNELDASLTDLLGKTEMMAIEKQRLRKQLETALSHVAGTRQTARGLVVNLPDILFDVNQATLKEETKIILAKLSGILLMMPELGAVVEGHTDATGSPEYNLQLSERRARSVLEFVGEQGVEGARLTADGFGMSRPVADNRTADGRAKNRRVEIIIGDGSTASNRTSGDPRRGS